MKTKIFLLTAFIIFSSGSFAQEGWVKCNTPGFNTRVDDLFMLNAKTGYAVCGDGKITKTIDGGNNWFIVANDASVYCRSVEFINEQIGFVGSFTFDFNNPNKKNILRRTLDGGTTWTDLTPLLNPRALSGICGLSIPDPNTIYGCGNWYENAAYIEKSTDGGNTWNFIDMGPYATSLIDLYFINKDTGFATGTGPLPLRTAVILYTTNGGQSWVYRFINTVGQEYCWKIQQVTDQTYYASIEDDMPNQAPKTLKSTDGGLTWKIQIVAPQGYLQGIGFINEWKGWAGGDTTTHESNDGGITWKTLNICPGMDRVFKVNDTLLFATGTRSIWKYTQKIPPPDQSIAKFNCYPNPANKKLTIALSLNRSTRVLMNLFDDKGAMAKLIINADKLGGDYKFDLDIGNLNAGIYYLLLKTHEDHQTLKVVVAR